MSPPPASEPLPGDDPIETVAYLYEHYLPRVERWAERLAGPSEDLEDLVHEVFTIAQRRWPGFRGESQIATWLFGITANLARRRRRKERFAAFWQRFAPNAADEVPSPALIPVEALERKQAQRALYEALDRIAPALRTAVIMFELEELSAREIAALTGVSEATVWVRVHRGRRRLLALLASGDNNRRGGR